MEPLIKCEHVDLGYENQDAVINCLLYTSDAADEL